MKLNEWQTAASNRTIDGGMDGAYFGKLMKIKKTSFVLMVATLCAASFAEELDSALEAQKKKVQRRVYSETAQLHDQNMTVPREASAEERALDKELQAMEARQNAQPSESLQQPMPTRPAATAVRAAETKNWLIPAALDDSASPTNNVMEDPWLLKELDRQKELKAQEAFGKENEMVEKLMREKTQPQTSAPELDRLKQYQLAPQKLFGSKEKTSESPVYTLPRSSLSDPLLANRRKETSIAPPLFSPEAARLSSSFNKNSAPARQTPIGLSPNWSEPEPIVLTPIQMIRKSSPINRRDPFTDDHMPKIKTSIWE